MRLFRPLLPFLLVACGTSTTLSTPGPTPIAGRPARESVLTAASKLATQPLESTANGAWTMRTTASVHAKAGEAPSTGSDDYYLGAPRGGREGLAAGRAAAPTSPGPAGPTGPATPAASATHTPLRAGSTDDNAGFVAFLAFLEDSRRTQKGAFVDLDVRGACTVRVVDRTGLPCPGMPLQIVDEARDKVVWRGTTMGDGRVPFYPEVAKADGGNGETYVVELALGDHLVRQPWNGRGDVDVALPSARGDVAAVQLDVAFVIDTTGSMQDEIDAIKATLLDVTARLRELGREFDLRYGAVLYRDVGDDYVTASHPFTKDIEAFEKALRGVQAGGGGDGPESLNQGLAVAVDGLEWREGAAKVGFLIADAPPHLDYEGDVAYDRSLRAATARGIRIHTVAASGLDAPGSVVFRQIAQWTRGEFVFLEYGGDLGRSAATHGVGGKVTGNNLDEILFTRIRDEIARWGR